MSDKNQQNSNSEAVPFFVRYLEGQAIEDLEDLSNKEIEKVKGGLTSLEERLSDFGLSTHFLLRPGYAITNKFPSDNDDRLEDFPPGFLE